MYMFRELDLQNPTVYGITTRHRDKEALAEYLATQHDMSLDEFMHIATTICYWNLHLVKEVKAQGGVPTCNS